MRHRALGPFDYGHALWSIFFTPRHCDPSLKSIVGSPVLSPDEPDQATLATFIEDSSIFCSPQGFR